MKYFKAKLLLIGIILLFSFHKAKAYGIETHFYETYVMLVASGIHPSHAERIASYAQWVDVSLLNSAMNPLPMFHSRVSRLLHFPTQGVSPLTYAMDKVSHIFDVEITGHGDIQNLFNVALRDSMIANELFNEALKTGSPYLLGASLHVLMDSYAHEGFNYIIGHGERGHYPDRPWVFVEKHNEMRRKLFKAIVRIRESLPSSALTDLQIKGFSQKSRLMNADQLFNEYSRNSIITETTRSIPHNDPIYKAEAVQLILDRMISKELIYPKFKTYVFTSLRAIFFELSKNGEPLDAWDVVDRIIEHLFTLNVNERSQFFNTTRMIELYGNIPQQMKYKTSTGVDIKITQDELLSQIDQQKMIENMKVELCQRIIPRPAIGDIVNSSSPKQTFENEYLYRQVEVPMQISKWQRVMVDVLNLPAIELTTEKLVSKIFLFLKTDIKDLFKKTEELEKSVIRKVKVSSKEQAFFMIRLFKYTVLDYATYRLSWVLMKLGIIETPIGNMRLTDEDVLDAKFWQMDPVFEKLKKAEIYKDFYTPEQSNRLISKWEEQNRPFAEELRKILSQGLTDQNLTVPKINLTSPLNEIRCDKVLMNGVGL